MISMNAVYYAASTMPLGDSTVTSGTTLFVPQWDDLQSAPNDVVCFIGTATDLDEDIRSVNGGGGMNCTASNGCGVHIHAGTSCEDKESQGGHWYNTEELAVDPWALIGYKQTDLYGYGQYASCVRTGFDVMSDPNQLLGHAFIVHAEDGSRVSCGLISEASVDFEPVTYTADTVPIPGIDVTTPMAGTVAVVTNVPGDGVCYMGYATGLKPNVESFLLGTGSTECDVPNGCGAHIHTGTGCENKEAQGGHYYDKFELVEDPWKLESYYTTDSLGEAALVGCVLMGHLAADYDSAPFIVHDTDGSRLLCGLLELDEDDHETTTPPTASPVAHTVTRKPTKSPVAHPVSLKSGKKDKKQTKESNDEPNKKPKDTKEMKVSKDTKEAKSTKKYNK